MRLNHAVVTITTLVVIVVMGVVIAAQAAEKEMARRLASLARASSNRIAEQGRRFAGLAAES